jgi:cobalt-zinc-cadmium efflux system outer membrane protein
LAVAAAEEDVVAAERSLALARGLMWPAPSLSLGFESHDPGGTENQALPTIGFSFPLPVLHKNAGAVAQAQAARDRAAAALLLARIGASQQASKALREATAAQSRLNRSAQLLSAAERVAALSLVAFREGAAALPSVLEAQRSARTAMTQYVNDLAAARTAAALLQFATLTVNDTIP